MNKIMVVKANSPALHKMGDIRRNEDEFIAVHGENEKFFIGNFITGFGFVNVRYPKENCRPLTPQEVNEINTMYLSLGGMVTRYNVDDEGNIKDWTEKEDKHKFQVDEIVNIKRTNGEWTEGKIIRVQPYCICVEVTKDGRTAYKVITDSQYETHIQRMAIIDKK